MKGAIRRVVIMSPLAIPQIVPEAAPTNIALGVEALGVAQGAEEGDRIALFKETAQGHALVAGRHARELLARRRHIYLPPAGPGLCNFRPLRVD